MKVLHIGSEEIFMKCLRGRPLEKELELCNMPLGLKDEVYAAAMPEAEVLVMDAASPISAELISGLPGLRLIHSDGVGFNYFDIESARKRGIPVCNCAGMNASAVAEQTLLLLLGMLRNVLVNDTAVREARQIETKLGYIARGDLMELSDCRVGLYGCGAIGQAAAKMLSACGAEVFYTQRRPLIPELEAQIGAKYLTSDELLSRCNVISMHLPVTAATARMCNDEFFLKFSPGSFFINTSRGELVDDAALIKAMENGTILMAGLDTIDNEPVQPDHPLLHLPQEISRRIVFSPHIGGVTGGSMRRGHDIIFDNMQRLIRGEELRNIVNR